MVIEVLPYLEIMGGSDAKSNTAPSLLKEGGGQGEDKASDAQRHNSFEKQGSLITLAWSKLPEDDSDCEAEAVGYSQDVERRLKTQIMKSGMNSGGKDTQFEETSGDQESEPDCTHRLEAQSAGMLCSTVSIIPIWCHHTMHLIQFHFVFSLADTRGEGTRDERRCV